MLVNTTYTCNRRHGLRYSYSILGLVYNVWKRVAIYCDCKVIIIKVLCFFIRLVKLTCNMLSSGSLHLIQILLQMNRANNALEN